MITGDSKISGRTAHPTFTSPKVRLTWNSPKCSRPASAGLAEPFRDPRMRRIQVGKLKSYLGSENARMHQDVSRDLLGLILDGFAASDRTKNWVRDFGRDYKLGRTR